MLREKFDAVTNGKWITSGLNVQYCLEGDTLLIQCSKGYLDWLFNFFAAKVEYDEHGVKVKAHAGFAALWLSIRSEIESLNINKMVLYSQGGAIGQAIHLNHAIRFGEEIDTVSFGTPRFFAKSSIKEIEGFFRSFKRYKNKRDVVTHTPTESMGFSHVGKEIVLPDVKFSERPRGIKGFFDWVFGHSQKIYQLSTSKFDKSNL